MQANNANRYSPTPHEVDEEVARNATETIHQRICTMLADQGEDELHYVRSLCMIATMFANSLSEGGAHLEVFCPEDELRRAKVPTSLRVGLGNRIILYPMDEETYEGFQERMRQAGKGIGEYEVFTRKPDGAWEYELIQD